MTLLALIIIPLLFAALVAVAPADKARPVAMGGMLLAFAASVYALIIFPWVGRGMGLEASFQWLPALGLEISVGADGVSMALIALTALLGPICVAASTTAITERLKTYYASLLVLQAAMFGVFAARDLILFYICFEFTLVPMYILISIWGSTNRKRAATKFFLYTFTGSIIALAGLIYVAYAHVRAGNAWSFDIATLESAARSMTPGEQTWVMAAMLLGFAVKVPIFPLHTWLPLAHTEAPTAGSVILAGVLLKLGTYAIFRFVLPFTPHAVIEHAPLLASLCIIGILYGGLICWVQTDVKKLVAYSSVAHLGFCMLGMFALNTMGLQGSVLYMINHGLSTGALFLLIGMVYERFHTRSMKELNGLASIMPIWASFMVFFVMASVGLPGLNGFVSEFLCLMGAFQASSAWGSGLWGSTGGLLGGGVPGATPGSLGPWYALIAGIGMVIAAIYLLYMTGKVVWGKLTLPHGYEHLVRAANSRGHAHAGHSHPDPAHAAAPGHGPDHHPGLPVDLNRREILTLLPLAVLCLALGIYPRPAIKAITPTVERTVGILREASGPGGSPTPPPTPAPERAPEPRERASAAEGAPAVTLGSRSAPVPPDATFIPGGRS